MSDEYGTAVGAGQRSNDELIAENRVTLEGPPEPVEGYTESVREESYQPRVETTATTSATASETTFGEPEVQRIERREEQLQVQKTMQEVGAVRVGKVIEEEQQTLEVPIAREEIEVTRRPANRVAGEAEAPYAEGDATIIPVIEERLEVRKVRYVVEEIEVHRRIRQDVETVTETVRKERLSIQEEGAVAPTGVTSQG